MDASFCSANEQMEVVKGSAMTREKGWEEEEGTNLLGSVDFSLAASRAREEKGKRRGDRGHFIGTDAGKKRAGIEAGARISPATVSSERVTAGGGR
jgi:hypothetical protein